MKKILCVGPTWRGSNAGGMFRALSRTGNLISVVDENYYINLSNKEFKVKALDKLFRNWHIEEFNKAILEEANSFEPDLIFVYKGAFVRPETLMLLKNSGLKLVNFYPDVSFRTHGSLLAKTLPIYDHVFTTKTFGIEDMQNQLGIKNASFVPHGFDPEIHRPLDIDKMDTSVFNCDVSFIGGYSEKKAMYLSIVKETLPHIDLKIWGPRWENCKIPLLQSSIMGKGIHGDLYVLGILSSKINLGLLHEKVSGASSGDKITSRTFHIPGAGGFMLHERTEEIFTYFKEDKEVGLFDSTDELCKKIDFYLKDSSLREGVRLQGNKRAWADHQLDHRALLVAKKMIQIINT